MAGRVGGNITPLFFKADTALFLMLIIAYKHKSQSKCINKTEVKCWEQKNVNEAK